jgi:hypothetical protein
MLAKRLVNDILENEALTRGLSDPEARVLVEWLVDRAESLSCKAPPTQHQSLVGSLCHRGRAISRFVGLWCHCHDRRAAMQLAAVERFTWELPDRGMDPCELMQNILAEESAASA